LGNASLDIHRDKARVTAMIDDEEPRGGGIPDKVFQIELRDKMGAAAR